ncbi:hypothetical protein A2U14_00765 [Fusobacterium necrophorum subsp. funduliforme]|uniref:XRE family transcriptional regulator n=1 Tax=Fusobacterium necrophorum TaxID=859 RepID=UPI000789661A|nr:XRE family transcriptional regulator [Fusobacterium necrophorum]AYV92537.1 helix-turn-helix transcriptional regulator [Fusobacterium necrophorum subsp. funduliforme]KYM43502.1 hypothetical protein A2U05_04195 [Fusobacterium necrophorum subsp. funduliforme]KYM61883.1 hypothetical protein A2U14_00765 [Fusobacterium necrophorum subsp. funduliforme]KYM65480.1 hypothetical protein A2U16_03000 [Fusobacterium necrophorum subsp. funduliforme]MDK4486730.1 XRE family transcriptional regulator [Fusoba
MNSTFKERLSELRKEKNISQEKFADLIGVSKSTISMYENGNRTPDFETEEKIADFFNVDLDYLRGRSKIRNKYQAQLTSNAIILDKSQFISVPVYGRASAGCGCINMETVLYDKVIHINGYSHDSFLIEVSGDSMEPVIFDGEFVLVDPSHAEIEEGKIYVITYNNETFIKKIEEHEEDGIVVLKSINQKYRDRIIKQEEFENVKINGRVVKVISERKL